MEIKYDGPLNSASWVMYEELSKLGKLEIIHFNYMKPCLKKAIEVYLTKTSEQKD
jgi:hypothetical protein